jgi:hypothetical protein
VCGAVKSAGKVAGKLLFEKLLLKAAFPEELTHRCTLGI